MKMLWMIFLASTTFAALPPLAQSSREIQAVLADGEMYQRLGSSQQIKEIVKTETGYLIVTPRYEMRVDVHYKRTQKLAGLVQFDLEFYAPVDLRTGEIKDDQG